MSRRRLGLAFALLALAAAITVGQAFRLSAAVGHASRLSAAVGQASRLSGSAEAAKAPSGVRLEDLTWTEAEAVLTPDSVVVLPIGAQAKEHGPHLKLRNDFTIADCGSRKAGRTPTSSRRR